MEIKILTLNCWLLPFNISAENRVRVKKIIKLIKESDADIVALQEIWSNRYLRILKEALGNYYFLPTEKKALNRPGLVTLTKIKPISSNTGVFRKLKKFSLVEKYASKGYHKFFIKFNEFKFLVINTHLYSAFNEENRKFAVKEFAKLKKMCRNKNSILIGDLNLGEKEFNQLGHKDFLYVHGKSLKDTGRNKYQKGILNKKFGKYKRRLDYVLVKLRDKKRFSLKSKTLTKPVISDHFAKIATIKI